MRSGLTNCIPPSRHTHCTHTHTHAHSHNTLTLGSRTEAQARMGHMPSPAAIPGSLRILASEALSQPPPLVPASTSLPSAQILTAPMTSQTIVATSPTGLGNIQVPAGLYLGEGFLPLPQRLVDKIARLEYVEMAELQPEAWLLEDQGDTKCCHSIPKRRRAPVTDVLTWVQCFASLASVLSRIYPNQVPELMAYMSTIVRCQKEFEGLGWMQYDTAFRRQAAISKDLYWGKINPTLYSICFAGHARRLARCTICLSTNHPVEHCPQAMYQFTAIEGQLSGYTHYSQNPPQFPRPQPPRPALRQRAATVEICMLYNSREGSRCTFARCRYAHICLYCRGAHSARECTRGYKPGARQSAEESSKRPRLEDRRP